MLIVFSFLIALAGCCGKGVSKNQVLQAELPGGTALELSYAMNFSAIDYGSFIRVEVTAGNGEKYLYCLYRESVPGLLSRESGKKAVSDAVFIKIPVKSVVSLSSENLIMLRELGGLDLLAGIDRAANTSSPEVRELAGRGFVAELGEGEEIDTETLYMITPDAVFAPWTGSSYGSVSRLFDRGFPAVVTAGWLEKHPLGRAEWICFVSLFLDRWEEARKIFSETEKRYRELADSALEKEQKPVILSNMVYGDSWGVPGGESYAAALFRDAGGSYPWQEVKSAGTIFLDFETVYSKAAEADIWLVNSSGIDSLDDITGQDKRYSLFSAFRKQQIYNNDLAGTGGGNPYWDEGTVYPDRILSDLATIFSSIENSKQIPGTGESAPVPGGKLYYFRKLE